MIRNQTQLTQPVTVLLLGNRRQSLTIIRSLASAGGKTIVAVNRGDDRNYHAHCSRFVGDIWEHDDYRQYPDRFREQLFQFLESNQQVEYVFPVDEAAIKSIYRLKDELAKRIRVVIANDKAVEVCLDKSKMLQLCNELDVACEPFRVVSREADLLRACQEIGFPSVIKPLDDETIWFGKKVAIVRSLDDLNKIRAIVPQLDRRLIAQKFASGPRHNMYFAAREGRLLGYAEVEIGRTDRSDGTGLAVTGRTIEPTQALLQDTEKLVAALEYSGVGCAQYLLDRSRNSQSFLELNPRLGANFAAVHYAGLPLAVMATSIADGKTPSLAGGPGSYRRQMNFAWSFGEVAGCRFELRQGSIKPFPALRQLLRCAWDALRCNTHITWSWSDPMPTLLEFWRGIISKSRAKSADRPA